MTVEQYREQLINYTLAFLSELEDGERVVREKLEATFDAFDNGPGRWIHVMPLEQGEWGGSRLIKDHVKALLAEQDRLMKSLESWSEEIRLTKEKLGTLLKEKPGDVGEAG